MNEVYKYAKQEAEEYDTRAAKGHWSGPDVVFGLTFEFIKPGNRLLDLGIGTGLSSAMFHKAGLNIAGLDGSAEILEVCKKRGFVDDLQCHDLNKPPFPYAQGAFAHVIAVGVLNLFSSLQPIIHEASRVTAFDGTFSFTVEDNKDTEISGYEHISRGSGKKIMMHRHSENYIHELLKSAGFSLVKRVEFWPFHKKFQVFGLFAAYVAKKTVERTLLNENRKNDNSE